MVNKRPPFQEQLAREKAHSRDLGERLNALRTYADTLTFNDEDRLGLSYPDQIADSIGRHILSLLGSGA